MQYTLAWDFYSYFLHEQLRPVSRPDV